MRPISVVILDEDIAQAGLQLQCINSIEGFTCTQLFTDPQEFLNSRTAPDIILLDLLLQNKDGITAMPLILKKFPKALIVINSSIEDISTILECISLGAVGYIDKSSFFEVIENVLKNIQKEGAYITPKIARILFNHYQHAETAAHTLTQRELQVAYLIKEGSSYKQVADRCGISVDTVRMHIRNIYKKLNVNSKVQLVNRISKSPVMHMDHFVRKTA